MLGETVVPFVNGNITVVVPVGRTPSYFVIVSPPAVNPSSMLLTVDALETANNIEEFNAWMVERSTVIVLAADGI